MIYSDCNYNIDTSGNHANCNRVRLQSSTSSAILIFALKSDKDRHKKTFCHLNGYGTVSGDSIRVYPSVGSVSGHLPPAHLRPRHIRTGRGFSQTQNTGCMKH